MVRISLLTDVRFRFFSYLKQSFLIEPKNDDHQQHPAVILVALYFNGYFFCGVICALMRSFRIFTLHIPTVRLACKLIKWLLFQYSRTFFRKLNHPFYLQTGEVTDNVEKINNYFSQNYFYGHL